MIHGIKITDTSNTPINYLAELGNTFNNGKEYKFNPGTNIIIGENGSGKTTLIDIIKSYTLCTSEYKSTKPFSLFNTNLLGNKPNLKDGIDVKANYGASTFSLRNIEVLSKRDKLLDSPDNFSEYVNSTTLSKGQQNIDSIAILFGKLFDKDNLHFPIKDIRESAKYNSDWQLLFDYYNKNNVNDNVITILMDEPEQNLDIEYTNQLLNILSDDRKDIQIICTLHSPLLIYKLSKLPNISIIELTKGYLEKVINFIEI